MNMLGFAADGNTIWYVDRFLSRLIHLEGSRGDYLESFYIEECKGKMFANGACYGNKIIFAPWSGDSIMIFDKVAKKAKLIQIKEYQGSAERGYFERIMIINDRAFVLPVKYPFMVEVDLRDYTIKYHDKCIPDMLLKGMEENRRGFFRFGVVWKDKVLVLPVFKMNCFILYNVESCECEYIEIPVKNMSAVNVCIDGDIIYILSGFTGEIYMYDLLANSYIGRLELREKGLLEGNRLLYFNLIDCGKYLLAIQILAKYSCKIDKKTLCVSPMDIFQDAEISDKIIICAARASERKIWIIPDGKEADIIGVYDIVQEKVTWNWIPEIEMLNKIRIRPKLLGESNLFSLADYIVHTRLDGLFK